MINDLELLQTLEQIAREAIDQSSAVYNEYTLQDTDLGGRIYWVQNLYETILIELVALQEEIDKRELEAKLQVRDGKPYVTHFPLGIIDLPHHIPYTNDNRVN